MYKCDTLFVEREHLGGGVSIMVDRIDVLDHGYVRLVKPWGTDLDIVNAARVSYAKETAQMRPQDVKLIQFLAREGHTSPFRHAFLSFEVYCPLLVARQWWKYVVGSDHSMDAWNESSRRYVTEEPTFYIPAEDQWRSAPASAKQGSGMAFSAEEGREWTEKLLAFVEQGEALYSAAMEAGIAAEQARLFLPAYGIYVRFRWSTSVQAVAHFLNQRMEHDAQWEIQQFAVAVYDLAKPLFEHSLDALVSRES